jgi:hypothetical protein
MAKGEYKIRPYWSVNGYGEPRKGEYKIGITE